MAVAAEMVRFLAFAVEVNAKMNYSHCISSCRIDPVYEAAEFMAGGS